jgi:predicted metalloprotease with PDZ domain
LGLAFILGGFAAFLTSPAIPAAAQVRYEISVADTSRHMVKVKIHLAPGASERDLQLPVWNAIYQIRDFAENVNWVHATDNAGKPLALSKKDKSRWHIGGSEDGAEVAYEIFADQPGPFGAQLNAHHAFFNLAEILMYPMDARGSPMQVRFTEIPSGWRTATSLATTSDGFTADNYDRLVDAPVEMGTFQESDFDEGGGHYRVVVDAEPADFDIQKMTSTLRSLVVSATDWMKDRPYQTYLFIYHFPHGPAGGGMEHAYSTAIDINAGQLGENSLSLGELTAHEFFHLWNVKRVRPKDLEPVDYTKENYTTALWFSEGVTTTAANFILLRAGLLNEDRYLRGLAAEIGELERRPAHLTQSAEESSLDTWLDKYSYYHLPTRSISYYNKGNLLGVVLDLQVREATNGLASLRDVFWLMNQNAQKGQFFSGSEGVRQAAESISHTDLGAFFQKYVAGTEEIPWDDFFRTVGLRVVMNINMVADAGFAASRNFDASPVVAQVTPGSEAERAGLEVGDVILEINGKVATTDFDQRLAEMRPGDKLHLRVRTARGESEMHWRLAGQKQADLSVIDIDKVTLQQRVRRAAWLRGESEKSGASRP